MAISSTSRSFDQPSLPFYSGQKQYNEIPAEYLPNHVLTPFTVRNIYDKIADIRPCLYSPYHHFKSRLCHFL